MNNLVTYSRWRTKNCLKGNWHSSDVGQLRQPKKQFSLDYPLYIYIYSPEAEERQLSTIPHNRRGELS